MTKMTIYIAEDGKEFKDYDECRKYEVASLAPNIKLLDRAGNETGDWDNAYYCYLDEINSDICEVLYDKYGANIEDAYQENFFGYWDDSDCLFMDMEYKIHELREQLEELETMYEKLKKGLDK